MKFPVIIKDGKSTITFTSNDHGTYESGAACMSTLEDMMVRVNSGKASIATRMDTITDECLSRDPRINAHNDLCDQVKAPQHLYAGEELDLTVCFNRKRFEQLQAQLTDFINKETPRYFVADFVYKVSKSGFVYRWVNESREWVDIQIGIRNLINMGAAEVTEADINAYTTITNGRAVYSTDRGRHFVMLDGKHLYEFDDEYNAVSYANRINGL